MKQLLECTAIIIGLIQLMGCCDVESFTYNIDIEYGIAQNRIPVNTTFNLSIEIPDILISNEGDENDISDLELEFNLASYNFSNDTLIDFRDFEVSTKNLEVEAENMDNNGIFITGIPTTTEGGREMIFRITPMTRDTILVIVGGTRIKEGTGQCAGSHQFSPINNQLRAEDLDIDNLQLGSNRIPDNALILEVF